MSRKSRYTRKLSEPPIVCFLTAKISRDSRKKTAIEKAMQIPDDLKYTESHEWVRSDGEIGTVGITDFAQDSLGDIVFLELPEAGTSFQQGETTGVVESVKTVSDILAPVGGEITEVNSALETSPQSVNKDPYGSGWLFRIRLANSDEIASLLSSSDYRAKVEK
jgi:glycine cleavage system H protein